MTGSLAIERWGALVLLLGAAAGSAWVRCAAAEVERASAQRGERLLQLQQLAALPEPAPTDLGDAAALFPGHRVVWVDRGDRHYLALQAAAPEGR